MLGKIIKKLAVAFVIVTLPVFVAGCGGAKATVDFTVTSTSVFGHTHHPFIYPDPTNEVTLANCGSWEN